MAAGVVQTGGDLLCETANIVVVLVVWVHHRARLIAAFKLSDVLLVASDHLLLPLNVLLELLDQALLVLDDAVHALELLEGLLLSVRLRRREYLILHLRDDIAQFFTRRATGKQVCLIACHTLAVQVVEEALANGRDRGVPIWLKVMNALIFLQIIAGGFTIFVSFL